MRSNVPIGKKNKKNQKCAAMWPSEKKFRKIKNAQQCGHRKKIQKN